MILDYSKQMELININKFEEPIHVLGCGALGSWITFILLKMGFNNIHVYDFDDIEEHNIPNQLFMESQIGKSKVKAMSEIYKNFFNDVDLRLNIHCDRLNEESPLLSGVILCAVDSMTVRKELYERFFKYNTRCKLWIEGRLSLYGSYIYTLSSFESQKFTKYEETLYADTEAEVSACGVSQTALPAAINAASIMIMQLIDWNNNGNDIYNSLEYSIPWLDVIKRKW